MKYTIRGSLLNIVKCLPLLSISLPIGALFVKTAAANQPPVVIESQVKGSQEQPKVIYILPWQGIDTAISIDGDNQKIVLPHFKPINPKAFKQQTRRFYQASLIKLKEQQRKAADTTEKK